MTEAVLFDSVGTAWTPPEMCDASEIYHHGYLHVFRYDLVHADNETMHFRCLKNHHLVSGSRKLTCLDSGEWSDQAPVCEVDYFKEKYRLSGFIFIVSFVLPALWLILDFHRHVRRRRFTRRALSKNLVERGQTAGMGGLYPNLWEIAHSVFKRLRTTVDVRAQISSSACQINFKRALRGQFSTDSISKMKPFDDDEQVDPRYETDMDSAHKWFEEYSSLHSGTNSLTRVTSRTGKGKKNNISASSNNINNSGTLITGIDVPARQDKKEEKQDEDFLALRRGHPLVQLGRIVREFIMS